MKKYILIISILFFSISAVVYYVITWNEINKVSKHYAEIQKHTYEIKLLTKNQQLLINNLKITNNFDAISQSINVLNNKINRYLNMLEETKNSDLIIYANNIKSKNITLNHLSEDIKIESLKIKNSLRQLSTIYMKYFIDKKQYDKEDIELNKYIFNILNKTKKNYVVEKIEPYKYSLKKFKRYNLKTHLDIAYIEHNNLIILYKKLNNNNILSDLAYIDNNINTLKKQKNKEDSLIRKYLLLSLVFLILYIIIIYIREAISKKEIEKLKKEVEQFVGVLNESTIVSKTDIDGKIIFVNDKFCKVSGYTKDELVGQSHNIVRHPDMPKEVFANLWKTIKNKKIFKVTIKNKTKKGEAYFVDTTIIPILDMNNEVTEYLAARYEVTELIESRDKAVAAEEAKDKFLSNMSHELRTPLNSIKGFSSILIKEVTDADHLLYLKNIVDSSEHLASLINDILDLSKLQSGKFTLDYHYFNIKKKIIPLLSRFNAELKIANLKIHTNLEKSLDTTLNGDWLRISQIIINLISNAIKFTPEGKSISLDMKYENKNLIIVVSDEGIGISPEIQKKIFKPFEQADSSITRHYGGTGLGLSIILNLLEQMKGKINLISKKNDGSRFEITIPLQETEHKEVEEDENEETQELQGHILIAEDNKTNQMLIGILIKQLGLTYELADDGLDVIDKFSKDKFDLILMDENMPKLNGTEAMKKIKSLYNSSVPIISLTANVMNGDKEKFLKAGMDGYLSKPIDEKELYKVLKSFLKIKH